MKLAPGLAIQKSPIDGKGCFATQLFPKGRKIAEYAGELEQIISTENSSGRWFHALWPGRTNE